MIVLDTNVISEFIKVKPDDAVMAWFETTNFNDLYVSTITEAELRYGAAILPDGRRRIMLVRAINEIFDEGLIGRILVFESAAAVAYAGISKHRRDIGRPMPQLDAQIAAIAKSKDGAIATRNVDDFADCGVDVINPWSAEA